MTSAVFGFKKGNKFKVTYNNSDSYPSGLGIEIASFVQAMGKQGLETIYNKIIMVNRFSKSTIEERNLLGMDGYDYLVETECRGNLSSYIERMQYMTDYYEWIDHQDYTYIINLDSDVLELYEYRKLINSFPFDYALNEMAKL